jgi:hypothetical protein
MLRDRVQETSTGTGTGNLALGGASLGYRTFAAALADGETFDYAIASSDKTQWEVGRGSLSGGNLVRSAVLESSNAGALVDFSVGAKTVMLTASAATLNVADAAARLYLSRNFF